MIPRKQILIRMLLAACICGMSLYLVILRNININYASTSEKFENPAIALFNRTSITHLTKDDQLQRNRKTEHKTTPSIPSTKEQNASAVNNSLIKSVTDNHTNTTIITNSSETFSACLLIKDDNDILNEWIAYHYHTLNLRHLVVATDPSSETSPSEILKKWRDVFGMEIGEWTDEKYMPDFFLNKSYHMVPNLLGENTSVWHSPSSKNNHSLIQQELVEINNHRFRQLRFLRQCMKRLKNKRRTWFMHIDTDEYVVINPLLRKRQTEDHFRQLNVPSVLTSGSLLTFLQRAKALGTPINYPCVSLPRLLFGSVEHSAMNHHKTSESGSRTWDRNRFETSRWKFHAPLTTSFKNNGLPKTMMDWSGIQTKYKKMLRERIFSIHRPSTKLCRDQDAVNFEPAELNILSINHYLGSWERFSARQDPRRNSMVSTTNEFFVQDRNSSSLTPIHPAEIFLQIKCDGWSR
jgi:hypothetical protein